MISIRSPQDFGAGIVIVVIGLFALYFGRDYSYGTAARMGPGYFPWLLSWGCIILGVIVALKSFATDGPPIESTDFRPIFFICAAILIFGFFIDYGGLGGIGAFVTAFSAFATREAKLREAVPLGIGMAIFCVLVFIYALGQPLPVFWRD